MTPPAEKKKLPVVFCSELSRAADEPLAATASSVGAYVLLSLPKRLWQRSALDSPALPEALRERLRALHDERGVVTRLVAHEGEWLERADVTLFPQRIRCRNVPLAQVSALLDAAGRKRPLPGSEPVREALLLVCTHGQRDQCCARFGLALVHALRAEALRSGSRVEVHEASHLGGDRFAPTALVLPHAQMYGHLAPDDAAPLLAAAASGRPMLARYRGCSWFEPLEQLAEFAAWRAFGEDGAAPVVHSVEPRKLGGDRVELRCRVTRGGVVYALIATCSREERAIFSDCQGAKLGKRSRVQRWSLLGQRAEPTRAPALS